MNEPAWKKLVEELRDTGHESVYLDRLRERLNVLQSQDDLKREILREMSCALGRSEDKVIAALLRLELLERELRGLLEAPARDPEWEDEVNARVDAFNRVRGLARHYLWELTVHREALGFRRNDVLREFYPVPPPKGRVGSGGSERG